MDSIFLYINQQSATKGFLNGLRIAVQPFISVAGWPIDSGSKALANYTALEDATVVGRLRMAGAHLSGTTQMSEFGLGLKDSKAGYAVQNKTADAELVLDLTGESRLAASRVSAFGFKPSYGLLSRHGLAGLIPSMECSGLLSDSLRNIREILRTVAGHDERDFSLPDEKTPDFSPEKIDPKKTAMGIIKEAVGYLNTEDKMMFHETVDELKEAGFLIQEFSMPDFSLFHTVHKIIGSVEASSCTGRYDSVRYGLRSPGAKNWNEMYLKSRGEVFGTLLKSFLFQGAFFQFERYDAYEDACRIRARLVRKINEISSSADFLVFPTSNNQAKVSPPESIADIYEQSLHTDFANVTGQPALHLPHSSGKEFSGFQLSGQRLSDPRLLALGEHLLCLRNGGK